MIDFFVEARGGWMLEKVDGKFQTPVTRIPIRGGGGGQIERQHKKTIKNSKNILFFLPTEFLVLL